MNWEIPVEVRTGPGPVRVNDVEIPRATILAEAQNHPASTPTEALAQATRGLVVRELLLQAARAESLTPDPQRDDRGRPETDEDALIRQIVGLAVQVPEADEVSCRRYYENNRSAFQSPDMYEAAHILFAADPGDEQACGKALESAELAIAAIVAAPDCFGALARAHSACSSSANDGHLGQITPGDTVPEIDAALAALQPGEICPTPIVSRFGVHVLRLDRRGDGRRLPFDVVKDRIADYLQEASWRRAVSQYIRLLAGAASVDGCQVPSVSSPLVQ